MHQILSRGVVISFVAVGMLSLPSAALACISVNHYPAYVAMALILASGSAIVLVLLKLISLRRPTWGKDLAFRYVTLALSLSIVVGLSLAVYFKYQEKAYDAEYPNNRSLVGQKGGC